MKITGRDVILLAAVVAVLGFLFMGKGRLKAGRIPDNDRHKPFYEAIGKGEGRVAVEKGCITCHSIRGVPLSKTHPPKEQCLMCHSLRQ